MTALIILLLAASIVGCVLRFAYRWRLEGEDVMKKPVRYVSIRYKLDVWAGIGFFTAAILFWWQTRWWTSVGWIILYLVVEVQVTEHGEKRFLTERRELLRSMYPTMSDEEIESQAMQRLKFEKKANASSGEYL